MEPKSMCSAVWLLLFVITARCYTVGNEVVSRFGCTWPYNKMLQLRCDYENCQFMTITAIVASRLKGEMINCEDLNRSPLTRVVETSCNYQLTEDHIFLRQVRDNCTWRQTCDIAPSNQLFEEPGGCGNESNSMRNWIHIRYECSGGGLEACIPIATTRTSPTSMPTTTPTTTPRLTTKQATSPRTSSSEVLITTSTNISTTTKISETSISVVDRGPSRSNSITNIILPVLGSLLLLSLMLVIGTVLYRYGGCRKSNQQHVSFRDRPLKQSIKIGNGHTNLSFKIDAEKLRELEDRLNYSDSSKPSTFTDHYEEAVRSLPNRKKELTSPDKPISAISRSQRTVSLGAPSLSDRSLEKYYSDSSISTTTNEDELTGKKRRRSKPFPPLPKPKIRHSEVYFTETETENESARSNIKPYIKPYKPVIVPNRDYLAPDGQPASVPTNKILIKNNPPAVHRTQSYQGTGEKRERKTNRPRDHYKKQSRQNDLSGNAQSMKPGAKCKRPSAKIGSDSES